MSLLEQAERENAITEAELAAQATRWQDDRLREALAKLSQIETLAVRCCAEGCVTPVTVLAAKVLDILRRREAQP